MVILFVATPLAGLQFWYWLHYHRNPKLRRRCIRMDNQPTSAVSYINMLPLSVTLALGVLLKAIYGTRCFDLNYGLLRCV